MNAVTQTANSTPATRTPTEEVATLLPPVDVIEDTTGITLYADLPGVSRDKLDLRVEGDQLNIEADLGLDLPAGLEAHHAEVRSARYQRSFTLSKELDAEHVNAELANGLLRVRIPKAQHATARKVQVRVA